MASDYGFITVTELENFAALDYSAIAAKYTDTIIEANITAAEEVVRSICGNSPTSATDGIKVATKIMARRLMHNLLVIDQEVEPTASPIIAFFDRLIDVVLVRDVYSPAGNIHMSGIDR